jgi:NAD(P)-dependent dehydrogenase (short-subunit alcohol dehydrogenase family)
MNKQVVLVTGASTGIGYATALHFAQQGYTVYGAARRMDKLATLAKAGVHALHMDVTDDASVQEGIAQIAAEQGRIDILVNNAGFGSYGAVEDVPTADARYQLEVNVLGAARLIQQVLPYMRRQRSGKVVNISSIGGKMATPFGGWYHASKFALEGLSDSLRNEVKPFGIDVIVIEPGGIESEWGGIAFNSLVAISGKGAYADMALRIGRGFEATRTKNPPASVIAELIHKAVTAAKPRTRYVAGYLAKPALFMRKLLPDRWMDRLMMRQVNQLTK